MLLILAKVLHLITTKMATIILGITTIFMMHKIIILLRVNSIFVGTKIVLIVVSKVVVLIMKAIPIIIVIIYLFK